MRLWSLHPSYLDAKGLVALWRETLLAQNVLLGKTNGYKNHPQLQRFKESKDPNKSIAAYLKHIAAEASLRGYNFNINKILSTAANNKIPVTAGQLTYEFSHLMKKLQQRDPIQYKSLLNTHPIKAHPIFYVIKGDIEDWEKIT